MKNATNSRGALVKTYLLAGILWLNFMNNSSLASPATLLFEDDFLQGIPGWTAVQPAGGAYSGTMLWQYDVYRTNMFDDSNIFTDSSAFSPSRIAAMLIKDTVAPASNFTYTVRMTARDDDGCGLIWGYESEDTFYRLEFASQARTAWPFTGWNVDRMVGGDPQDLFGKGLTNVSSPNFTFTFGRPFHVTAGMP